MLTTIFWSGTVSRICNHSFYHNLSLDTFCVSSHQYMFERHPYILLVSGTVSRILKLLFIPETVYGHISWLFSSILFQQYSLLFTQICWSHFGVWDNSQQFVGQKVLLRFASTRPPIHNTSLDTFPYFFHQCLYYDVHIARKQCCVKICFWNLETFHYLVTRPSTFFSSMHLLLYPFNTFPLIGILRSHKLVVQEPWEKSFAVWNF